MGLGDDLSKAVFMANYAQRGETSRDVWKRVAGALADGDKHFEALLKLFEAGKFWPGGRILANIGTLKQATAVSSFASGPVEDNLESIMQRASEAARTMAFGGGVGVDFSRVRPRGGKATGPVSFMQIFDAVGQVITEGGSRRGKILACLPVQHPDVTEFLRVRYENVSPALLLPDNFMQAVVEGREVPLLFGKSSSAVPARDLWQLVMQAIYDTSAPMLLFPDRINRLNPLNYCETLHTTTLYGEVPLPHYGSCPVGAMNLSAYKDMDEFGWDVGTALRALDNVIDRTKYPLPQQEQVAKATRRVGLGVMGLKATDEIETTLMALREAAWKASVVLGKEKGIFPSFAVQDKGEARRNSHMLAISPNKIIAQVARTTPGLAQPTPEKAIRALRTATPYIDNGVAMKIVVPTSIKWPEFNQLLLDGWNGGAKCLDVMMEQE